MNKSYKTICIIFCVMMLSACVSTQNKKENYATIELLVKEHPECGSAFVVLENSVKKIVTTPNKFMMSLNAQIKDEKTTLLHIYATRLITPNESNKIPHVAREEFDVILVKDIPQEVKLSDGKKLVIILVDIHGGKNV